MQLPDDSDRAADLLERLLTDPEFRRAFRADPAAACRTYELDDVASDLEGQGKALYTLELRESRSSLAGLLMAAAAEGVGVGELIHHLRQPDGGQLAAPAQLVVTRTLARPSLQDAVGAAEQAPAPVPPASDPAVAAVVANPRVDLSDQAHASLTAGAVDHRVVAALSRLGGGEHAVGVKAVGPASIEISSVAGRPVAEDNAAARDLLAEVAKLQPSTVGSPWNVSTPGFFSDADHSDRINVTFGDAATPVRATGQVAAVQPQDAPAVAPVAEVAAAPETLLPDGSDVYPGDGAPKEEIAAWMGRQAHKAGLPAELPVMAGLVESGLTNHPGGDRDSAGFFQMRAGIWDQGAYAGYPDHPELQLKWFIDHALAVKSERLALGDNAFLHDSSKWGDWIADVERPAEEYRGRYQLRLEDARQLLQSAALPPAETAALTEPDPGGVAAPQALAALAIARSYLGTPYKWGGETPDTGFDCSGLAEYAYAQVGIHVPRVAADQFQVGEHISRDGLEAGDLVFFQDSSNYVHHVGIYVGDGKFLHAPHTGDVVKISSLDEPYYQQQFAGGRRYVDIQPPGVSDPGGSAPGAAVIPTPAAPAAEAAPAPAAPAPVPSGRTGALAAVGEQPAPGRSSLQVLPVVPQPAAAAEEVLAAAAPAGYPGDGAPKEALAQWMAAGARSAGLPGELPVLAALAESSLQNLRSGDRDSLGFFQMRAGIWNQGEYAGFVDHPELQLKWFIKEAVILREKRIAAGDAAFGQDPSTWGEWVADVERPAAELRGRYQEQFAEAQRLLGN